MWRFLIPFCFTAYICIALILSACLGAGNRANENEDRIIRMLTNKEG